LSPCSANPTTDSRDADRDSPPAVIVAWSNFRPSRVLRGSAGQKHGPAPFPGPRGTVPLCIHARIVIVRKTGTIEKIVTIVNPVANHAV
jgi:hypothetical protein